MSKSSQVESEVEENLKNVKSLYYSSYKRRKVNLLFLSGQVWSEVLSFLFNKMENLFFEMFSNETNPNQKSYPNESSSKLLFTCVGDNCSNKFEKMSLSKFKFDQSSNQSSKVLTNLIQNFIFFDLRDQPWTFPLLLFSLISLLSIFAFQLFVIYKAFKTVPSRRHLFLGQFLLLSLFISAALGFAFVSNPTKITCALTRSGVGFSYNLIFSALLVKSVFLLSLHTGTYLPISYQSLLLFFIITTQLVINVQWTLHQTPQIILFKLSDYETKICNYQFSSFLYSLLYNMLLILIITILSIRIRSHRENFREAIFILISILCTIFTWIAWISGSLLSYPTTQDAFIGFGIVFNSMVIFLIMFTPKAKQLFTLQEECGYLSEDRDGFDSPSSQSLCAQSFVHLKPSYYPCFETYKSSFNLRNPINSIKPTFSGLSPPLKSITEGNLHFLFYRYQVPVNLIFSCNEHTHVHGTKV